MKNEIKPPKLADFLLSLFLSRSDYDQLSGDFEEIYHNIAETESKGRADIWYWKQLIKCLPNFIIFSIFWGGNMLKNYFKIALRNITKHKGYAFINIAGLAIGLASCIIIMLFVLDEFSYDRYHENNDRIYRIERKGNYKGQDFHSPVTAHPFGPSMKAEIPGVEEAIRIDRMSIATFDEKNNTNKEIFYFADENLFSMFSFELKEGEKNNVLSEPNSVVLSEKFAARYFNSSNVVGERLRIEWRDEVFDLKVTGIMEKIPENSHFTTDAFVSYSTLETLFGKESFNNWISSGMYTYIMIQEGITKEEIQPKVDRWHEHHLAPKYRAILGDDLDFHKLIQLYLRPLDEIHLYSNLEHEISPQGDVKTVSIFFGISILILLIACINFMNLSTARSAGRAKEVGLRKVVGATRKYLMNQFLAESIFLTIVGLFFAILTVEAVLPYFNSFTMKNLSFNYLENPLLLFVLLGITLFTGLASGLYPAAFLSSFNPVKVLQGTQKSGTGGFSSKLRSALVIFQFVITITLMIGTITLMQQMAYMKNKNLGFEKEQVVVVNVSDSKLSSKLSVLIPELINHPNIKNASLSYNIPGSMGYSSNAFKLKEADNGDFEEALNYTVDKNYVETLNIQLAAGRNFLNERPEGEADAILINEVLAKKWGFANSIDAIDHPIQIVADSEKRIFKIAGVIKDFNFKSLKQDIESLVLFNSNLYGSYLSVKINSQNITETLEFIKNKISSFSSNNEINYFFLDENFDKHYRNEERMQELFSFFSILAIIIACLGLFGLAAYITEKRTKEIGIRKVLGADVRQIIRMLSKQFIKWVAIANIIAWPIGYWVMNGWLQDYAYRIELGIIPFISSGVLAVVIALVTVTYQTYKAAIANPINSISCE